jgi:hypothetical protein
MNKLLYRFLVIEEGCSKDTHIINEARPRIEGFIY